MDFRTIAVTGAGEHGRTIALAAALAGYRTILEDVMLETLEKALTWIRRELGEKVGRGEIEPAARNAALERIEIAHSFEHASRDADFLFDATPDEWELKLEIFTLFDKFARPGTVLASVTSSLSIADLASMTYRPELCAGLRFSNAGSGPPRVEIVRAPLTAKETLTVCREAAERFGWRAVIVNELSASAAP